MVNPNYYQDLSQFTTQPADKVPLAISSGHLKGYWKDGMRVRVRTIGSSNYWADHYVFLFNSGVVMCSADTETLETQEFFDAYVHGMKRDCD